MSHSKPIPNPLEALKTSLQMEFEFELAKYNPKEDILRAKKRQLELLKHIMAPTHTIVKARTADKPQIPWDKLMKLKTKMPTLKQMINGRRLLPDIKSLNK